MTNELEDRVTTLETTVSQLNPRMDTIENLAGTAARFSERTSERVDRLELAVRDLQQDVSLLYRQNARLETRMDGLESKMDGLESGQRSLVAGQQRLESMVTRILERLEGGSDG